MMSIYFYVLLILIFVFNNIENVFKVYVRCNSFCANEFLTSNNFIYCKFHSAAIFNIPHRNVLSSSHRFYHFSFSFYEYTFFINTVFYIVNSVTNIFNDDLYITYLFDVIRLFF